MGIKLGSHAARVLHHIDVIQKNAVLFESQGTETKRFFFRTAN